MDIDSLTQNEKQDLIEGYFCYPLKDGQNIDEVLLALIEYHESNDEDLFSGLSYWSWDTGPKCGVGVFDAGYREEHLFK